MTLRELLQAAGSIRGHPRAVRTPRSPALAYRSESVTPGALFFCVPGFVADGHDFAPDAVTRGAAALVCERPLGLGVPEVLVPSVRAAMAPLAAAFHGHPTAQLRVVGVTGTNGKTTTAFLVRHVLESPGIQTGLLGTVQSVVGGRDRGGRAHHARGGRPAGDLPPDARRGRRGLRDGGVLARARAAPRGRRSSSTWPCSRTSLRTTSTSTARSRTTSRRSGGCSFPQSGAPPAAAVVNVGRRLGSAARRRRSPTGAHAGRDVRGRARRRLPRDGRPLDASGSTFTCHARGAAVDVRLPLPGLFNVYNALGGDRRRARARRGAARGGRRRSRRAQRVPGRFEPVDEGQAFGVLVDYAHTPDSLENVLAAARELLDQAGGGRLIVRVRRRRRPRPRQAPADGRGRARALPTTSW